MIKQKKATGFGHTDVTDKNLVKTSFSVWWGQKPDWSGLKNDSEVLLRILWKGREKYVVYENCIPGNWVTHLQLSHAPVCITLLISGDANMILPIA